MVLTSMWPFVKKNYFALDCLEGAILEDETSQFDHLIKAQPRIINQTNKEGNLLGDWWSDRWFWTWDGKMFVCAVDRQLVKDAASRR